ncbi:radical SAM protein [candidate division CSSED10-310 bacterium]|uniref:Radical SAM protein n=1 Tax=candidate division CSSED10-310 bacterium TaxID=2855610 RepID=A0ABV6YSY5_UNCC1
MKQASKIFEVFVRQGFEGSPLTPDVAFSFALDTPLRRYNVGSPFFNSLPELKKGDNSFFVFVDELVRISAYDLRTLAYYLLSHQDVPGIVLDSVALETLYQNKTNSGMNRLFGKRRPVMMIPSWFCVLNREYLLKYGMKDCRYHTLEFFLFELSVRLARNSKKMKLLEAETFHLDYRSWAQNIILMNSSLLATDYETFIEKNSGYRESIPHQFKVQCIGKYITVTSDLQNEDYQATSQKPMFSVICPAYKSQFFAEMIESVVNQSCHDWELIVLIDGPPESERERLESVLKRYTADPRIRSSYQKNMGTGPTRRRLAQMARGDFLISIDDDDLFHQDILKVFAQAIRNHPGVNFFRGGTQLFGLVDFYLPPKPRTKINGISCDIFEATQPFVIKRSILEQLGGFIGDESIRQAGEDSDLFLNIDQAGFKTCLVDKPLYSRRISTLNQTLFLSPDECLTHIKTLIVKHSPPDWSLQDIRLQEDAGFVRAIASYRHHESNLQIIAPTKFFDYQTLGESSYVKLDLEISSTCNADCIFCPRQYMRRDNKFISLELIDLLARQIEQEPVNRQVILCGIGEPMLHPELVTITRKLFNAGARVCMTTNGSLMSVTKFIKLVEAGMVEFNFSLNAALANTHRQLTKLETFENIISSLRAILDYKKKVYPEIEMNFSFVVCPDNQDEVSDFVSDWSNSGVTKIWLHPVNNRAGLVAQEITTVDIASIRAEFIENERVIVDVFQYSPPEKNVCQIAQGMDFISVDGQMLLCALDYSRSFPIGKLQDMTLTQMHLTKFRKYKQGEMDIFCQQCSFFPE